MICYVRKLIKVWIMFLVVVANFHRKSIEEGMLTYIKKHIRNLLESVILKLEISDEHESERVLENEDYKILWDFSGFGCR